MELTKKYQMTSSICHYWHNDNLPARTKFVYTSRKNACKYEAALNLVCLFVAEELFAFQWFWDKQGPNQTHVERVMIPDFNDYHPDWIEIICKLKNTPDCVKNMLSTENPFHTFHQFQIKKKKNLGKEYTLRHFRMSLQSSKIIISLLILAMCLA